MPTQVSKKVFAQALLELGHNPDEYSGKRLTLEGFVEIYEIEPEAILDAIDRQHLQAHYDYQQDTIWIDALDAAHFYFCIKNEAHLYSPNP